MTRLNTSSHRRGFFASRAFIILGLLITVLILFANIQAFYRDRAIRQDIAELEWQRRQLSKKKLESMEILEYVTSQDFVEEKARTELNMRKPGENVVIVKELSTQTTIAKQEHVQGAGQATSNPVKWWYYFLHISYEG